MNYWDIKIDFGRYPLRVPFDEDNFYCPFCAYPLGDFQPYSEKGHPSEDMICPGCDVQPGDDDTPTSYWKRSFEDFLMAYRINWLDHMKWHPESLARLNRVLGIEESELREHESELRAEWKRCSDLLAEWRKQKAIRLGWIPKPDSE